MDILQNVLNKLKISLKNGEYTNKEHDFVLDMSRDYDNYGIIKEINTYIPLTDYDEVSSLYLLLSSQIGISKTNEIVNMKNRAEMYSKALSTIDEFHTQKYDIHCPCISESNRVRYRILIKFIGKNLSLTESIETTFLYLLLKVGEILRWNSSKKYIYKDNWEHLNNILRLDKKNYEWGILKFFDKRVLSCFAYMVTSSEVPMEYVMNKGYEFLKLNIGNGSTANGSLYLALGEINVIEIINRIVQVMIDNNNYSFKELLINQLPQVSLSNVRYDTQNMKKHSYEPNAYVISTKEYDFIKEDIVQIKETMNNNDYLNNLSNLQLYFESIDFENKSTRLIYTPFTSTGTTTSCPYKLCLFAKKNVSKYAITPGFMLIIEYNSNTIIEKFKYVVTINSKRYEIHGNTKDDILMVSKILCDKDRLL